MLAILSPADSLTVVMSGSAAATNPTYHVIYEGEGGGLNDAAGSLAGATAVTVVSAPSEKQKRVKSLDIFNGDTAAVTVTISKTGVVLFSRTLSVGDRLHMDALGIAITSTTSPAGVGAAAGTGVTASEQGNGIVQKTVLSLAAMPITVTDALAYASQKVYDFPEGRILILGVTASIQWAVTTDRAATTGTINDSASLTWALGTVAASNITLSSTMVDLLPKTTKVLAAATTALNTASTAALAASAQFDGTATPKDALLNVGFETNTDIDNDGILTATGTITITWVALGDY